MDGGYNKGMIRKQILSAREHSTKDILKRTKTRNFRAENITSYPVFQNVRNILQELHLLLAPDKEHKKVFSNVTL